MLIIFDCDGVLVDSELLVGHVHAEALAAIGLPVGEPELRRRFTGMTDEAMYAELAAEWGREFPPAYHAGVKARIEEAYRTRLRAVPGVPALLATLAGPVCVASSANPAKLHLGLSVTGLLERFAPHVFSAAEVPRGKPAPDLFLHAAARMGFDPATTVVVEDSPAGVQAGLAAGMRVLAYAGPGGGDAPVLAREGADVFTSMGDLPRLLRS